MANVKYRGTGSVASTDFHSVKWTGKTKSGKAVVITMPKAINMGDIDWSMVEKMISLRRLFLLESMRIQMKQVIAM